MIQNMMENMIKYYESLSGTVKCDVDDYMGFKFRGKIYSAIKEKKDCISILVERRFIRDEEILGLNNSLSYISKENLNIEFQAKSYYDINKFIIIIKRAYDAIRIEYEGNIHKAIKATLIKEEEYVFKYTKEKEFVFSKLVEAFDKYKNFDISRNELEELSSDFELLDDFNSELFLEGYFKEDRKYRLIESIYEMIAYIEASDFNINKFNKYDDKRVMFQEYIGTKTWVRNFIYFKKYKDLYKVTEEVRNFIRYINNPIDKLNFFCNYKIGKFLKYLRPGIKVHNSYEALCREVFKALEGLNINLENMSNLGVVYSRLMYCDFIFNELERETCYFKLQPYKDTSFNRNEIEENLKNESIILKSNLLSKMGDTNVFYAVDEEKVLFLGYFLQDTEKIDSEFYRVKFRIISKVDKLINSLCKDSLWGRKPSNKNIIKVKDEDKELFEHEIIDKLFGKDINLLNKDINEEYDSLNRIKNRVVTGDYEKMLYVKEITTPINTILYGTSGTGKTYSSINYAVSIVEKKEVDEVLQEDLENRKDIIRRYKNYVSDKRIVFTSFHESYSYEEFIEGRSVSSREVKDYFFQEGVFKDLVERARVDIGNNYVIIIDDINRANISRVFGELTTIIEEDKRLGKENEIKIKLPSKEVFGVPANLFIIGTMNNMYNKNSLDISFKRRFDFIFFNPKYELIPNFEKILRSINNSIYDKKKNLDYLIGHSIFINKDISDLKNIVNKKLILMLSENFTEEEIKEILLKSGIEVERNEETFKLEYKEFHV